MPGGKTSPKQLELALRRQRVIELRVKGRTLRQIAQELKAQGVVGGEESIPIPDGYDQAAAYKDVAHVLEESRRKAQESADELRQLELERLDMLMQAFWEKAVGGDVFAVGTVLQIMQNRTRYVDGLLVQPAKGPGEVTLRLEYGQGIRATAED